MVALPACSKKAPPPDATAGVGDTLTAGGDATIARAQTPQGGSIASVVRATATVTAVDPATRKVTLKLADGSQTSIKCGPAVANFGQIKVNDRVNVTTTEELAIYLPGGDAGPDGRFAGAALAPVGAKPAGAVTDFVQITAKVAAVDAATRVVTLALPDGSTEQIKAGEQVDLSAVKPGDNVIVRHTEALAVSVVTP
jgi:hypothetical protein